jgi:hypothetical protein
MVGFMKKLLKLVEPSLKEQMSNELQHAEHDFLHAMTHVDHYAALAQCHANRIRRLRTSLRMENVLARPQCEEGIYAMPEPLQRVR